MSTTREFARRESEATAPPRQRWRWMRLGALLALLVTLVLLIPTARLRYYVAQGETALEQGDLEAAQAAFLQASEIDPDAPEPRFWLARVYRKQGDFDAVRKELDAALRLGYADDRRLREEWWLVLAEAGHLDQVESRLPELLQKSQDTDEVCEAFVNGYCLHLRFGEAFALLDAWQADYPEDYRPHLRRGQIHASLEDWPQAEEPLRRSLDIAPENGQARRELARALLHLGHLDEAKQHITSALRSNPDDVEALAVSAKLHRELKEFETAREDLMRILELDPNDSAARLELARVLLALDEPAAAAEEAEQLAAEWPDDLETVYTLARALRAAGRTGEAEKQFEHYEELARVIPDLERLKNDVKARPDDAEIRYQLGQMLLRYVSRKEGVAYLQSVLLYDSDHAGAHKALADYHQKWGDAEVASRHRQFADLSSGGAAASPEIPSGETP